MIRGVDMDMETTDRILLKLFVLVCALLMLCTVECWASEQTLARLSFWAPPERMDEFAGIYEEEVSPILDRHGFVVSPEQGRGAPDSVFCRLFRFKAPADVMAEEERLHDDPAWNEALRRLEKAFGASERDSLIRYAFGIYYAAAGPGKSVRAGPGKAIPSGRGKGHWRTYDTEDGLAGGKVTSICQDREGSIWFATQGGGVSRYDGQTWTTYTVKDGLAGNQVLAVFLDREGYLWFGTDGEGVSRFDGQNWTTYTVKDGLADKSVYAICQDHNGHIWFGTGGYAGDGNGVSRYDGQRFVTYTKEDGLADNSVLSIFEDRDGNLWFGTLGGGVSRYDGQRWVTFTTEDGLANQFVYSVFQDREGHLWFGADGGVSRYDGRRFLNFSTEDGLAHSWVFSIFQDRDGILWFGTLGGGVSRYDGQRWVTFTTEDGLANQFVYSVFQDREGYLWFGTDGGGVSRYDERMFTTFTEADGLGDNRVWSSFQDREGNLWFSTRGGGVSRYDGRTWVSFTEGDGVGSNRVLAVFQDREGNLWFGTDGGGVSRYDGKTFTTFTREDGLAHDYVYSILQDREGHLWFGTGGIIEQGRGISRYDGQSFTTFTEADGLAGNFINSILQDRDGYLWVGTGDGVSRYDGRKWVTFTRRDGLADDNIHSILQDRKGNLWFGTWVSGVSRYDGEGFSTLTTDDGLADNQTRSMLQDRDGHLWFCTLGGGVSRYDGQVFQKITRRDGLAGNEVRSILEDRSGCFWLGTIGHGVTRFCPPAPFLPSISVDAVVTSRRYENVSEVAVASAVGLVAFEFAGRNLRTRPEAMVYRYRLRGYDEDWRNTHAMRVEYQNLSTGDYVFEVLAVDRDLVYSEKPATVKLQVYYQPMSSSVKITDLNIQDVFASFYKTYAEQSIGSAVVSNEDANPIEATISFYLPDVMGRPTEQTISLGARSSQRVSLQAVLNPNILNLKSGMPVQAEVALSCKVGEQTISVKESRNITLHGRGALTWDSLGRAAAFVTPEDRSVAAFARGLYDSYRHQVKGRKIDGNIPAAMLMFEALNGHGIKYAKDSSTPYSQVRSDRSAVDHIQYPVELLHSKMGDCDDCTVLYCALLENLNIPTAFVDAPSHILMMFDSGVTARHEFGFSLDEDRYVLRDDRFWLPVEVTRLGEGSFTEAWELGAKTCSRLMEAGQLRVTDVRDVWPEYPYALPLVEGDLKLPDADLFEKAFLADLSSFQAMREDYVERTYIRPLIENPDDHLRRMDLARVRVESEDYNGAISALTSLLNTELKAEAYYLIGYAYAGQKNHETAVAYFEKALEHDSGNEDYAHSLGVLKGLLSKKRGKSSH